MPIQPGQLQNFLRLELGKISACLAQFGNLLLQDATVAPASPQEGMMRRALSPWTPISGVTDPVLVIYSDGAWVAL